MSISTAESVYIILSIEIIMETFYTRKNKTKICYAYIENKYEFACHVAFSRVITLIPFRFATYRGNTTSVCNYTNDGVLLKTTVKSKSSWTQYILWEEVSAKCGHKSRLLLILITNRWNSCTKQTLWNSLSSRFYLWTVYTLSLLIVVIYGWCRLWNEICMTLYEKWNVFWLLENVISFLCGIWSIRHISFYPCSSSTIIKAREISKYFVLITSRLDVIYFCFVFH